jgi:broad specificity phosphatase PhoE
MTRMLLVRHGQSEWNAVGRWQGQADPVLTDTGRHQARTAAERLGSVDVVVASPLLRALETAQILAESLGVGPVVTEAALMERDVGEWSGLTKDEIEQRWPGHLAEQRRPPGFEADDALLDRAADAVDRIAGTYSDAEVLVITHGGVVTTLERAHGLAFERLPNLGGRWLAHHGDGVALGDRVLLVDPDEMTVPSQT